MAKESNPAVGVEVLYMQVYGQGFSRKSKSKQVACISWAVVTGHQCRSFSAGVKCGWGYSAFQGLTSNMSF